MCKTESTSEEKDIKVNMFLKNKVLKCWNNPEICLFFPQYLLFYFNAITEVSPADLRCEVLINSC